MFIFFIGALFLCILYVYVTIMFICDVTGYHAGLWDNCHYNVTENVTLEACLDKLTREWPTSNFCTLFYYVKISDNKTDIKHSLKEF